MKGTFIILTLVLTLAFGWLGQTTPLGSRAYSLDHPVILVGSGGITGVYYQLGRGICRFIDRSRRARLHNFLCQVEATGGSVFNLRALRSGDIDLGLVQSDVQAYAYRGEESFAAAGPESNLRALFAVQAEAFTLVARDDSKINNFEDLAGKRLNLGDQGSGSRNTLEILIRERKWTSSTFQLAAEYKTPEMAAAMCDNKIDAFVYVVAHPNGSIREATNACDSHIVPVDSPFIQTFLKDRHFYPRVVIPNGMYRGVNEDIVTFGPRATLMTTASLSEEAAYQVTKAVISNLEEIKSLHPALASVSLSAIFDSNTAPFHPGAEKYYREIGLIK
ncbi:MAG: TAXI family TRAP transporter solute-binding subunit [Deltaproteobacteria bacterium]|jgi:TRAP transporter TAXI family solute receptor|nr:TAXI family TRAP transporter solute-binding subunit [Deltaproteobacteria bacterium]